MHVWVKDLCARLQPAPVLGGDLGGELLAAAGAEHHGGGPDLAQTQHNLHRGGPPYLYIYTQPHLCRVQVYINWLYLIFLYLTPITLLTILNIRIYRSLLELECNLQLRCRMSLFPLHVPINDVDISVFREVRLATSLRANLSR